MAGHVKMNLAFMALSVAISTIASPNAGRWSCLLLATDWSSPSLNRPVNGQSNSTFEFSPTGVCTYIVTVIHIGSNSDIPVPAG